MTKEIVFTSVNNYNHPTVLFSFNEEKVELSLKEARQLALNLLALVDRLEGESTCPSRLNQEKEIPTCRLKFWANPKFRI